VSVYSAPWYTPAVQRLLDLALEEDVGRGDVTSAAVIDETQEAEAEIVVREKAVVCGLGVVEAVFTRFDWRTRVRMKVADGDPVTPDTVVAAVRGPAAALLAGERTALNFLQHLSGIATLTQAFVAAAEGVKVRVTDTRKTLPGLRALEKYAVRVGGGANHRSESPSRSTRWPSSTRPSRQAPRGSCSTTSRPATWRPPSSASASARRAP